MIRSIFSLLICLSLFGSLNTVTAQTKTWIGPIEGDWTNGDNWSPMGAPTGINNVIIPSGSEVNVNLGPPYPFMDTLTVESGAIVNKLVDGNMTMTHGHFQEGSTLNMFGGDLVSSSIVLDGIVIGIGPLEKGFRNGLIEVNNTLTIEAGSGPFELRENTLRINPTGVLNLPGDGIIDIAAFNGTLENQGLIQKTGGTGDFVFDVSLINNGGSINIGSGNLLIPYNGATLTDGLYNVGSESAIIITSLITYLSGTLTGLLDGPIVFQTSIVAPNDETVVYNFSGSAQVEWAGGAMSQGDFMNEGLITITDNALTSHTINGISLTNNGIINLTNNCQVNISNNGQLHNTAMGTINLLDSNVVSTSFGGQFLNNGEIIKAASGKNAFIRYNFINDGGALSILGDTLVFNNPTGSFIDGQYDVFTGGAMSINDGPSFQGTLTGQLDGPMELMSGSYGFAEIDTTVFNFSGTAQVDWYNGTFAVGNLKNMSTINAKSMAVFANQISGPSIVNEGLININGVHGIFMTSGTMLNTTTGVIDIQADNLLKCGDGVTNLGILKKSGGTGVSQINDFFFHNDPGLIQVEVGTIDFSNLQEGNGNFAGSGALDLGNYEVNGEVSPGNSVGELSILGNYESSAEAMPNIELNGSVPGVDFDVLAIENSATLEGGINLTMGFAPVLGEQFEIITAASVESCLLPATVNGTFEGETYIFDVICNDNNVTLGFISVGINELSTDNLLSVYPNPMSQIAKVDLKGGYFSSNNARLLVNNNLGQTVRIVQIPNGTEIIDLNRGDLQAGLYHVLLMDKLQVISKIKLMIE